MNIAYEAVDRHVAAGRGDVTALRWVDRHDTVTEISYAELAARANLLRALGVGPGERVFTLLGRVINCSITKVSKGFEVRLGPTMSQEVAFAIGASRAVTFDQ